MQTLEERMSLLKEKHDTQVTSDDTSPTPLATLLYIYNHARYDCYIDYMEGAKALIKYLSPIEMPNTFPKYFPVPSLLLNYELTELAKLLSPPLTTNNIEESLLATRLAERAIIEESL